MVSLKGSCFRSRKLVLLSVLGGLCFIIGQYVSREKTTLCFQPQQNDLLEITDKHDGTLLERKRALEKHCKTNHTRLKNSDIAGHILINIQVNLAMCFVPKTGCTFWKRLIYAVQEAAQGRSMGELFDVGKRDIHLKPIRKIDFLNSTQEILGFWQNATKIVFARDPYSRLFSAYIDKFFLPDFWGVGQHIKRITRTNNTAESLRCGHDIAFEEFLRYVIQAEETGEYMYEFTDDHWQPVARICQPCDMGYNIIAKQETFSKDRDSIISKLGIASILPKSKSISFDDTNKDTMNQTIDDYWYVMEEKRPCMTQLEIVVRFWRSFQIQGYIPSNLDFPHHLLSTEAGNIKESFRMLAMEMYEAHMPSPELWKRRRADEMSKMYKEVPTYLMKKIQTHFRQDFEMFSYDIRPDMLYSYR